MAANDSVRSIFIDICRYLLDDDDDDDDALRIKTYGATSRTNEPEPDDNGVEHNNGFGPAHVLFVHSRDTCEPMWTNGRARASAPARPSSGQCPEKSQLRAWNCGAKWAKLHEQRAVLAVDGGG